MKVFQLLSVLAGSSVLATSTHAAVVFSDDFSEAPGTIISGKAPDVGGTWNEDTTSNMTISALNSADTTGAARYRGTLHHALGAGQILTLSFDARVPKHNGYAVVTMRTALDGTEQAFVGAVNGAANGWGVGGVIGGDHPTHNTTTAAAGNLTSFTYTYEFDTGNWTYSGLGGPLSGTGTAGVALATIDIRNNNGGDIEVDNLVVDISNVPEPGSLALLGLGGLFVLRRRRHA